MHRIDGHINDIEPRIKAITENTSSVPDPTMQDSLSSYGWVLLDAWIAWRSLRYLLKDAIISEDVDEKWFSTPSSYTASQLKAIWRFNDMTLDFIYEITGKKFKDLIDSQIQAKRNASAHFTKKVIIQGRDFLDIDLYYKALSRVFLLYETKAFLEVVNSYLKEHGYNNMRIQIKEKEFELDDFLDSIKEYYDCKSLIIKLENQRNDKFHFKFDYGGCTAWAADENSSKRITTIDNSDFYFFKNKGYYLQTKYFADKIVSTWASM